MTSLDSVAPEADPWDGFEGWEPATTVTDEPEGALARFVRRFRRQRVAVVALGFVVALVLIALAAPLVAPADPLDQELRAALEGPSIEHWLGTDEVGRDVLSRMIYGARVSLLAAAQAVIVALVLGVPPGLVAGYFGRWVDTVVSRVNDTIMSFPPLLLAIAIVGIFGPNLRNAMFAVGIIFAPRFLRLTRGAVMAVKEETYVEASRSIGTGTLRILRTRILPNILSPLLVQISLSLGFAMLAEASLSFLGLGVQPPQASWGAMVGRAYRFLNQAPTLVLFPGLAIVFSVLAFNLLGDGLRDSFGRETRTGDA
ncbi:MAG: ABC transporter permease [Actinomycetota bacterium]|nr:ABC transporter permease [Actinomycetota bacterium]